MSPDDTLQYSKLFHLFGDSVQEMNVSMFEVDDPLVDQHVIETDDDFTKTTRRLYWKPYRTLSQIYRYLSDVEMLNNHSKVVTIGKTINEVQIKTMVISNENSKMPFLVEGGIHAREWSSVSAVLNFIDKIVWNFSSLPMYIQEKEWHILPVSNPEGYEYSMNVDRMWKKNRRPFSGGCNGVEYNNLPGDCIGADLVLNIEKGWNRKCASKGPCAVDYCGPEPFSELETQAIRELAENTEFQAYVSVRSFGSRVLYPSETFEERKHEKIATEIADAMSQVNGNTYNVSLYRPGQYRSGIGSSLPIDWMYTVRGVKNSFQFETRVGIGAGGFHMDADVLSKSNEEVFAGISKVAETMLDEDAVELPVCPIPKN